MPLFNPTKTDLPLLPTNTESTIYQKILFSIFPNGVSDVFASNQNMFDNEHCILFKNEHIYLIIR
ncbi:MAG: hypothetical protein ACJAWV_004495 [Flammeovirgaceae bacterium]|jgi:hypothetical protein